MTLAPSATTEMTGFIARSRPVAGLQRFIAAVSRTPRVRLRFTSYPVYFFSQALDFI